MTFLLWFFALILFGPFAVVAFCIWASVLILVLLIRLVALLFGIAAWAGLGSVLFPGAIAAGWRKGARPPGARTITVCANCPGEVRPHPSLGWIHADSGAVTCGVLDR